jgi:glyoxalase family protein
MIDRVQGIHHITAIGSDPQALADFYTGVLGLRLVKKSVNQDDVSAYHLFFGDRTGEPGMDLTFFTFPGVRRGSPGVGQVTLISLAVPEDAFNFWQARFQEQGVRHEKIQERFGRRRLRFYDPDDQQLELVAVPEPDLDTREAQLWTTAAVGEEQAIRHFHSAHLSAASLGAVEPILIQALGYDRVDQEGQRSLYRLEDQLRSGDLEIEEAPGGQLGINAAGTVHHIAFGARDEDHQLALRERVLGMGLQPTQVIDRYYFKSVYFRIPAGILFEIATMGPGFTADEDEATLGERLALPPFLEDQREAIEAGLPPVHVPEVDQA